MQLPQSQDRCDPPLPPAASKTSWNCESRGFQAADRRGEESAEEAEAASIVRAELDEEDEGGRDEAEEEDDEEGLEAEAAAVELV